MSKPAIDEILETVSEGHLEHPIFGKRWMGQQDDEDFLLNVDEYILKLQKDNMDLIEALGKLIDATTRVRGMDIEDYCPRKYSAARATPVKARGEIKWLIRIGVLKTQSRQHKKL